MDKSNPKRWIVFGLALAGMLGIILYAAMAKAACKPSDYACADFTERRAFPQDGKCLDFGASQNVPYGDLLNRIGRFESSGGGGTCDACPSEFYCDCSGTSSISIETANVKEGDFAVSITTDASNSLVRLRPTNTYTLEADSAYLLSVWSKGSAAGDDFYSYVDCTTSPDGNRFYTGSTDTWGAVQVQSFVWANIGTDWVQKVAYITTGAVQRTGCYLYLVRLTASQTFYLDDFQIRKLRATGPEFATRERMSYDVAGDPGFECDDAVGCYAVFDGDDDGFERADDGLFQPADGTDSFSVACRFRTKDNTKSNQYLASSGVDWYLTLSSGNDAFLAWNDAVPNFGTVAIGNFLLTDAWNSIVAAYQYRGPGAAVSDAYLRANNEAEDQDVGVEPGPIRDLGDPLGVGFRADSTSQFAYADIAEFCYYSRALSAVERNQFNNPFFGATNYGDGFYVDTCSQAATHSVCAPSKCVDWNPNSCWPDDQAIPIFGQYTEGSDNNSFEDGFTGWTINTNDGGTGVAEASIYPGDSVHGDYSARLVTRSPDGFVAYTIVYAPCVNVAPGDTIYADVSAKNIDGDSDFRMWVVEHNMPDCATGGGPGGYLYNGSITNSWKRYGGSYTTTGLAASVEVEILNYGTGNTYGDLLLDAFSLKVADYPTPWAHCPAGSGTCTYNARDYRLHNPLADEHDGAALYEDGFCVGGWVWTAWADDGSTHYIIYGPGTSGSSNRWQLVKNGSNHLGFNVYDSVGNPKSVYKYGITTSEWSVNSWKYIEACTDNAGVMNARFYDLSLDKWTDMPSSADAGTGIQDGAASTLVLGSISATSFIDGYIRNLSICPYASPFPKCGWGRPPVRAPY